MDEKTVRKLLKGEKIGFAATLFCAVAVIYFVVCYSVAKTQSIYALELVALISAPVLIVIGAAVAAFCNIKFGGAIDRIIKNYVQNVCIENAAKLHPERNSISFYLSVDNTRVNLTVNGYKDKTVFDFSAFGKLSLMHKISVLTEIENRLTATFCRLYERGAKYAEVCFAEREGTRRKSGKTVYIIKNGAPDEKAYKSYLKYKRSA